MKIIINIKIESTLTDNEKEIFNKLSKEQKEKVIENSINNYTKSLKEHTLSNSEISFLFDIQED